MQLTESLDVLPPNVRAKAKTETIHVRLKINAALGAMTYVVGCDEVCLPRMDCRLDLSMAVLAEWYAMSKYRMRVFSMESIKEIAPNHVAVTFVMIPFVEGVRESY